MHIFFVCVLCISRFYELLWFTIMDQLMKDKTMDPIHWLTAKQTITATRKVVQKGFPEYTRTEDAAEESPMTSAQFDSALDEALDHFTSTYSSATATTTTTSARPTTPELNRTTETTATTTYKRTIDTSSTAADPTEKTTTTTTTKKTTTIIHTVETITTTTPTPP